jgi:hypothetical protein
MMTRNSLKLSDLRLMQAARATTVIFLSWIISQQFVEVCHGFDLISVEAPMLKKRGRGELLDPQSLLAPIEKTLSARFADPDIVPSDIQRRLMPYQLAVRFVPQLTLDPNESKECKGSRILGLWDSAHIERTGSVTVLPVFLKECLLYNGQAFSPTVVSLLYHEIFHAIHFVLNPNEESWVREGLAMLFSERVTGVIPTRYIEMANLPTTLPMTSSGAEWVLSKLHADLESTQSDDHGAASSETLMGIQYLYFKFLNEKCSQPNLLWDLASAAGSEVGLTAIDLKLKDLFSEDPICGSFAATFKTFTVWHHQAHKNFTQLIRLNASTLEKLKGPQYFPLPDYLTWPIERIMGVQRFLDGGSQTLTQRKPLSSEQLQALIPTNTEMPTWSAVFSQGCLNPEDAPLAISKSDRLISVYFENWFPWRVMTEAPRGGACTSGPRWSTLRLILPASDSGKIPVLSNP